MSRPAGADGAERRIGGRSRSPRPPSGAACSATRRSVAGSAEALLAACREAASKGERVAVLARAEALAAARDAMRRIAQARLAVVAHAISGHGGEELAALTDLGWGVLCASGPEDSFDLALIARRAAEDCGVPFVVVHAHGHVGPRRRSRARDGRAARRTRRVRRSSAPRRA